MNLRDYVRDIQNYPKECITFFDIAPILSNPEAFQYALYQLS